MEMRFLALSSALLLLAPACSSNDAASDDPGGGGGGGGGNNGDVDGGGGGGGADADTTPSATFVENGGFVVMETETIPIPDGHEWESDTELAGYSGAGYYAFLGNGICNGPAGSPLEYDFSIANGGKYELRMRMTKIFHCAFGDAAANGSCVSHGSCNRAGAPDSNDECPDEGTCFRSDLSNDVFVHILDSEGEYVAWKDQPSDTVGDPIKLFVGGGANSWQWSNTKNLDVKGSKWDAQWDLPAGNYVLVVSGRSQLTRFDRMVLFDHENQEFNKNTAADLPETR